MLARRKSRILAMSMLYALDVRRSDNLGLGLDAVRTLYSRPFPAAVMNYATYLVKGVLKNVETLDALIHRHVHGWAMNRLSMVDRQIMRVAVYEFAVTKNVPARVSINEAVLVAKIYGEAESGKFVNAVLDAVNAEVFNLERPARTGVPLEEEAENAGSAARSAHRPAPSYLVRFAEQAAAEQAALEAQRAAERAAARAAREEEERRLAEEAAAAEGAGTAEDAGAPEAAENAGAAAGEPSSAEAEKEE